MRAGAVSDTKRKKKRTAKRSRGESDPRSTRVRRLRAALNEAGVDALLVTNPVDIRYLTGFPGDDSAAFVTSRSVVIVSDFRFEEELNRLGGSAKIVIRKGDLIPEVIKTAEGLGIKRLGLQAEHLRVATRSALAKGLGARRLKDTRGLLQTLRIRKDAGEIALIRRAVRIQQDALLAVLETIAPGQTESAICAQLEYEIRRRGAEGVSFGTIIAARANGSLPHAVPGGTKTAANKTLLIDWGARFDGYCSDMTRTFTFGRWPKPLAEVYEVVLEAHLAAIDAVAPGVRARDVDAVARNIIRDAGYGDRFGHGLGHGIGLDIHEAPRLSARSDDTLEAGMVVTIEPGVYLPGVGGVRIEDDVLVTERGRESLCLLPKTLDWATR